MEHLGGDYDSWRIEPPITLDLEDEDELARGLRRVNAKIARAESADSLDSLWDALDRLNTELETMREDRFHGPETTWTLWDAHQITSTALAYLENIQDDEYYVWPDFSGAVALLATL